MADPVSGRLSGRLPAATVFSSWSALPRVTVLIPYREHGIHGPHMKNLIARLKGRETGWDLRVKNLATDEESLESSDLRQGRHLLPAAGPSTSPDILDLTDFLALAQRSGSNAARGHGAGPLDVKSPTSHIALIKSRAINPIAPRACRGLRTRGDGIVCPSSRRDAAALVLGTGFSVSHTAFMDDAVRAKAGLKPLPPGPRESRLNGGDTAFSRMRPRRAHALAAPRFRTCSKLGAMPRHCIASYLRADGPSPSFTLAEATQEAERDAAWLQLRYPTEGCFSYREVGCLAADALANWPWFADMCVDGGYGSAGTALGARLGAVDVPDN
ncbi:hypothetical protein B0H11DRAFT_1935390 [Mycena galericulata]|nr:hypothetical protein B0H11DRAFT_1935390 [Mycena galericulata]